MHDGFLQCIRNEPDEDAHRLVYADFLDEHGDSPRAEFIRIQVRLARGEVPAEDIPALRRREHELLLAHEPEWTAPLHRIVQRVRFVRGFVERVTLLAEGFVRRGKELFRLTPARHVILTEPANHLQAIARSPWLASVATLEFRTFGGALYNLVLSPHLTRLSGLIMRFSPIDDTDAALLGHFEVLAGLTLLDLYGTAIGGGLRSLTHSQHLSGVQTLVLNGNEHLDEAVVWVFSDPEIRMTRLTTLGLGFTRLGDAGARTLASAPHLASLRTLDVKNCGIGPDGARALVDSPSLQGLTLLDLRGNELSPSLRRRLQARLGNRVKV